MNTVSPSVTSKHRPNIGQYFLDLHLAGPTTWGRKRILTRNLWIGGCYLAFTLGVFARQVFSFNGSFVTADYSTVSYTTLLASFAIGMVVFPFALRSIVKLVTWVFKVSPLNKVKPGFNIVHLMMSYAIGYFFNLIAEGIPLIISKFS